MNLVFKAAAKYNNFEKKEKKNAHENIEKLPTKFAHN